MPDLIDVTCMDAVCEEMFDGIIRLHTQLGLYPCGSPVPGRIDPFRGYLFKIWGPEGKIIADPSSGNLKSVSSAQAVLDRKYNNAILDPKLPASIFYYSPDSPYPTHPGVVCWDIANLYGGVTGWKGLIDHLKVVFIGRYGGLMSHELADRLLDPEQIPQLALVIEKFMKAGNNRMTYTEVRDAIDKLAGIAILRTFSKSY